MTAGATHAPASSAATAPMTGARTQRLRPPPEDAAPWNREKSIVTFSFSKFNSLAETDRAVAALLKAVAKIRSL